MAVDEQNKIIKTKWERIYHEDNDNLQAPTLKEELNEEKFIQYEKAIDDFTLKNKDTIEHLKQYADEYSEMENEEGRLPHLYNVKLYISWMVFLVILEIPTNYTTIEQFLHKPVISTMITIAIGSLLVLIAHAHGKFFKQLPFINSISSYNDSYHRTSKITRYIFAIAGYIGLAIIMYGLYYARLQYFNSISGVDVDDPFSNNNEMDLITATIFTKVGILMLANFAIYTLGVIGSYKIHEVVPGFQEAYYRKKKYSDKLQKENLEFRKRLKSILKRRER